MFVLTEPIRQGLAGRSTFESARPIAAASIGSPTRVPVPWASTYCTAPGSTPASRKASRMRASCASALGTVRPTVRPSWLMAVPRTTA